MKLLEQMRQKIKMQGLSPKTFDTYAQQCEGFFRYLLKRFGEWKHPRDVGRAEIEEIYVHADQHQATSAKSPLESLLANPQAVIEHRKAEEKPKLRVFAG